MMVAKLFVWTLCFALLGGVCGFAIKTGNNHGQNQGGGSQSAVGYDASKSGQRNPVNADQSSVRYGNRVSQSTADQQVGSVASDQMDYRPSSANNDPAGPQQQGSGTNAQALSLSGSNTGAFPQSGAVYGGFPLGSHASGVGPEFGGHATDYKGGDLFQEDGAIHYGNYKSETEESGPMPQPLPARLAAPGYSGQTGLLFGGYLPYYYDYRFLTGQYPRGTYAHTSISHSHGLNHWNDAHYVRDYVPYVPRPERPPQPSNDQAVPMNVHATRQQNPVVYQGSAPRQQVPRQDNVRHQGRNRVQTPGQFGGMAKV